MQAMILAAGFGTRLLPHTRVKPKPLFPILNQPLLLLTITRLRRFGFSRIIVNCHHLRDQIETALQGIEGVIVQSEEIILGTGGGLRRALPNLADEPLLVTNGDIYHTIDYRQLMRAHLGNTAKVTMAMHDCSRFNKVVVSNGYIEGFDSSAQGVKLAFTGLHVLEPEILELLSGAKPSCIIDHYRALLKAGEKINVFRTDDCFWTDMGTPADYLDLHEGLLTGKIPRWQDFEYQDDNEFLVSDEISISAESTLREWCAIGRAQLHGANLARSVVWDGVVLPEGYKADNELISVSPA